MSGSNTVSRNIDGQNAQQTPADQFRAAVFGHWSLSGVSRQDRMKIADLALAGEGYLDGPGDPSFAYRAGNETAVRGAIERVANQDHYKGLFARADNRQAVRQVPVGNANLPANLQAWLGNVEFHTLAPQTRMTLYRQAMTDSLPERRPPGATTSPLSKTIADDPAAARAVASIKDPATRLQAVMARREALDLHGKIARATKQRGVDPSVSHLWDGQIERASTRLKALRDRWGPDVIPISTPNAAGATVELAEGT